MQKNAQDKHVQLRGGEEDTAGIISKPPKQRTSE